MKKDNSEDSTKKREYVDYLEDILEAVEKAEEFVEGIDYETFKNDDKTLFATLRASKIIGEATKKIPGTVKNNYPEIPWREMAGIRDKLIHDYFGVNIEVVWKTLQEDLPSLRQQIKRILEQQSGC